MGMSDEKRESPKYTEAYIQKCLDGFFATNSVKYNIDGLYVFAWESDKLLETKAGYIYEFEIKISKADFKNDFKHKKSKHEILEACFSGEERVLSSFHKWYEKTSKNQPMLIESKFVEQFPALTTTKFKKPNYFYYAVPKDMISPDEIPEYAGLVYVNENGRLQIIKKAPALHKDKYTDEELNLSEKFYYNMRNWREKKETVDKSNKLLRERLNEELETKGQETTYSQLKEEYDSLKKWVSHYDTMQKVLEKDNKFNLRLIRKLERKILDMGGTWEELRQIDREVFEEVKAN